MIGLTYTSIQLKTFHNKSVHVSTNRYHSVAQFLHKCKSISATLLNINDVDIVDGRNLEIIQPSIISLHKKYPSTKLYYILENRIETNDECPICFTDSVLHQRYQCKHYICNNCFLKCIHSSLYLCSFCKTKSIYENCNLE